MQATLRRPLCVLRGSFLVPQRAVTPLYPWPLVTAMTSITSSCSKMVSMDTGFSKRPWPNSTLSATEPPLTWISIRCAFFCLSGVLRICVWASTRTTVQYFLMRSISRVMEPLFSECFLAYLVKAFFLLLYQFL